jgi:hypothetical protein
VGLDVHFVQHYLGNGFHKILFIINRVSLHQITSSPPAALAGQRFSTLPLYPKEPILPTFYQFFGLLTV